jgi:hypothetical protein
MRLEDAISGGVPFLIQLLKSTLPVLSQVLLAMIKNDRSGDHTKSDLEPIFWPSPAGGQKRADVQLKKEPL